MPSSISTTSTASPADTTSTPGKHSRSRALVGFGALVVGAALGLAACSGSSHHTASHSSLSAPASSSVLPSDVTTLPATGVPSTGTKTTAVPKKGGSPPSAARPPVVGSRVNHGNSTTGNGGSGGGNPYPPAAPAPNPTHHNPPPPPAPNPTHHNPPPPPAPKPTPPSSVPLSTAGALSALNHDRAAKGLSALSEVGGSAQSCAENGGAGHCGANEAFGYSSASGAIQAWYAEGPGGGHYDNMMNSAWTNVDFGFAKVNGQYVFVANFGCGGIAC